jgi:hypothetical protein
MPTEKNDVFEQRLDETMQKMLKCQGEQKVKSCSECEHFLECEVRRAYIKAVYDSMSKGETGGFEF